MRSRYPNSAATRRVSTCAIAANGRSWEKRQELPSSELARSSGLVAKRTTADGMTILTNAGLAVAVMPMVVWAMPARRCWRRAPLMPAFHATAARYAPSGRRTPGPSTGLVRGACPGHHVDLVIPLCAGGADHRSNMQWITREDHRFKTLVDVRECRRQRAPNHSHASDSPGTPGTPDPPPHGVPARGSLPAP